MLMGDLADALTLTNVVIATLGDGESLTKTKLSRDPHIVRGGEVVNAHSVAASHTRK